MNGSEHEQPVVIPNEPEKGPPEIAPEIRDGALERTEKEEEEERERRNRIDRIKRMPTLH